MPLRKPTPAARWRSRARNRRARKAAAPRFHHRLVPRRGREAACPFHRFCARTHLDQRVAGHQFIAWAERAVDDVALAVAELHAPAFGAGLQPSRVEQHTGGGQLLVVARHGPEQGLIGHHAGFAAGRGLDDDEESHGPSSHRWLVLTRRSTMPKIDATSRSKARFRALPRCTTALRGIQRRWRWPLLGIARPA